MMRSRQLVVWASIALLSAAAMASGQGVEFSENVNGRRAIFRIGNERIECSVLLDSTSLLADSVTTRAGWSGNFNRKPVTVQTDADFCVDVMWTGWQAPGKANNAENPVTFGKKDFRVVRHAWSENPQGGKRLTLFMKGIGNPFEVRVAYELGARQFYLRRQITVVDSANSGHFLRWLWSRKGNLRGSLKVIKNGGFGQPIGFRLGAGGAFFGLEYPAAENVVAQARGGFEIGCKQEIGERIGPGGVSGDPVVEGITPDPYVKLWFMRYVDDIRIAPVRPYTLYNSWYDLRSPDFSGIRPENVMNEANALRIIGLLRSNMVEKHGIHLDAFVLDDGWDVYASDWVVRTNEFPSGFAPLSAKLREMGTHLGLWLGPIGGYSFSGRRVGWMKEHGYEVVGNEMCVAGRRYDSLLTRRVTDFAREDSVAYYKWDGIQFSCSEPDHGHPVGIYSRRAVMEAVAGLCRAARAANPEMFLNITSGTWLSPWWLRYANQIWMQGEDYGYADVPSISPRDAAITYRDFVLFDDLRSNEFWFPVSNMMTHGIIKGVLQQLGGEHEPLDKFTNEVLLYLARGVSMWEMYISPDILTEGEWNAIGTSMVWARDRFPVLSRTEMVGGDPRKRQTYGYVHFNGSRGIIAARNPWIKPSWLRVPLQDSLGLDTRADSLVLERVYPTRWISPRLYREGDALQVPLDGYETAVYEIAPLREFTAPLVAGLTLAPRDSSNHLMGYGRATGCRILNPGIVKEFIVNGSRRDPARPFDVRANAGWFARGGVSATGRGTDSCTIRSSLEVDADADGATFAILLAPAPASARNAMPDLHVRIDGIPRAVRSGHKEGSSRWFTVPLTPGKHACEITLLRQASRVSWRGRAEVWVTGREREAKTAIVVVPVGVSSERPMPPSPWPEGETGRNIRIGSSRVILR